MNRFQLVCTPSLGAHFHLGKSQQGIPCHNAAQPSSNPEISRRHFRTQLALCTIRTDGSRRPGRCWCRIPDRFWRRSSNHQRSSLQHHITFGSCRTCPYVHRNFGRCWPGNWCYSSAQQPLSRHSLTCPTRTSAVPCTMWTDERPGSGKCRRHTLGRFWQQSSNR